MIISRWIQCLGQRKHYKKPINTPKMRKNQPELIFCIPLPSLNPGKNTIYINNKTIKIGIIFVKYSGCIIRTTIAPMLAPIAVQTKPHSSGLISSCRLKKKL